MGNRISFNSKKPFEPFREIVAYEALWWDKGTSYKTLSKLFSESPDSRPSDFVDEARIRELYEEIKNIILSEKRPYKTNILIRGTYDYPKRLGDAIEQLELLYYTGDLSLLHTPAIAVVGARKATEEGVKRTEKLVKLLVKDGYTIVSGLAQGVDTAAHTTAIQEGGKTIAVIGTPLDTFYPKQNTDLQLKIAKEFLLISQVPFYRYKKQTIHGNRFFFPERNKTMSALTRATVIVEASDTSGTLVQARAALKQGRKLFILENCFRNPNITWPERFLKMGAHRVKEYSDITNVLGAIK